MNIKEIFKQKPLNPEAEKYVSSFKRSAASMIDLWIVLFLRVITMQILGRLWLNEVILDFIKEFSEKFGTQTPKNTPEHLSFIAHHRIFAYALIFYAIVILIGTFYHACLNSSRWRATIGKRLMKIMMTKENGNQITFRSAVAHYFLSILPFVFIFYLLGYQIQNHLTFYKALTASELNVFLGFVFIIWVQIHLFTQKKTTAYDIICRTILVNGKTSAKFPWSKI